jgi:hypothetical protein
LESGIVKMSGIKIFAAGWMLYKKISPPLGN